ncbi:GNAT family N-acetyltransferase [Winslowiella iniecta]|uniref:N-acetyltransferase domain-containing protein n=1 Tax=Winslowiella iniecta TaxID=1560201 RepID=A0A0L7T6S1_9GAMM|nr:GNAT family N-acetyltransferase [Winslowiella iniecta]KOC88201.1 hypothetical protein NG43_20530 [Winslowiella iniecta]KOC91050.1 hypothetical protein NG42_06280 [Winslowiella iniecta]
MGQLKKGIFPFDHSADYHTENFDCGSEELNRFLKTQLARQHKLNVLRANVLLTDEPVPEIMGYYTLSGGCYEKAGMSSKRRREVPYENAPCILLGRLAVDRRIAGRGFGSMLVAHAAKRVYQAAQSVGVYSLYTEAKDEQAAGFYQQLGFTRLTTTDGKLMYFCPVNAIEPLIDLYPF